MDDLAERLRRSDEKAQEMARAQAEGRRASKPLPLLREDWAGAGGDKTHVVDLNRPVIHFSIPFEHTDVSLSFQTIYDEDQASTCNHVTFFPPLLPQRLRSDSTGWKTPESPDYDHFAAALVAPIEMGTGRHGSGTSCLSAARGSAGVGSPPSPGRSDGGPSAPHQSTQTSHAQQSVGSLGLERRPSMGANIGISSHLRRKSSSNTHKSYFPRGASERRRASHGDPDVTLAGSIQRHYETIEGKGKMESSFAWPSPEGRKTSLQDSTQGQNLSVRMSMSVHGRRENVLSNVRENEVE